MACAAVQQTKWHSWCTGKLAKGCELCVQGRKLVLFVTGLCGQRCFYCPVSEHKFGADVVYANEWQVTDHDDPAELIEEARLTEARGAGITGGDPLVKVDRCCAYIRLLKQKFGREFHIHLYTPLKLVTQECLRKLADAGLDEIRFHPNLDDDSLWHRLEWAKAYDWDVGVEIPAIPGYEDRTRKLIDVLAGKVGFLNLNELELSDTQARHYKLDVLGYKPKDDLSYGVKGSKEMALKMLAYARSKGLPAHFCTAKLKDAVQMKNRLKRRAKHARLPFDIALEEGTLLRGCLYTPSLAPGVKYAEKLQQADKDGAVRQLEAVRVKVLQATRLRENTVIVDHEKLRLILPCEAVKKHAKKLKKLGLIPAIVEEYPTADALEVEVDFL